MAGFSIATERLVLRDFEPGDFEAFFAATTDPEYRQFYPAHELTRAHYELIFERILPHSQPGERTSYQLAVCLPAGELIGTCGVRMEDAEHRQASFGCAIGRAYWRKGYALEASRRLIDFGFSSLPIHRLYAETNGENHRARALAEHLGMRLEGRMRESRFFNDRWWDTIVYAILAQEWKRAASQEG